MDGESVATHKGVRVDDVVDSLPVFPVSLLLNKTVVSQSITNISLVATFSAGPLSLFSL